jgi:hypothetical protein
MTRRTLRILAFFFVAALHANSIWACAACYGQSDSPMAAGMNWGIMSLLGMIVVVLGGVAAFFIFLARRSAALAKSHGQGVVSQLSADSGSSPDAQDQLKDLPLAARGGLRPLSPLARQRERCTHAQSGPGRLTAPRGRN